MPAHKFAVREMVRFSGLLTSYGWDVVLWVLFAPLLVALAALVFNLRNRSPHPAQ